MKSNSLFNRHDRKIVLASSSPRRSALLSSIGLEFEVFSPDIDESFGKRESPRLYALRMASEKARIGAEKFPKTIVIAADTVVAQGRRILDKACSDDDIRKYLTHLSGRGHIVYTGLTVIFPDGRAVNKVVKTTIKMKNLSKKEIEFYISSGEGIGKAGGYGIQNLGETFIRHISGSYSAVLGLPLFELSQILKGYSGE